MTKLVVLQLDGDLRETGFKVTLALGEEGQRPDVEVMGTLPPNPELAGCLQNHWQEKYAQLSLAYPHRIKPVKIDRLYPQERWIRIQKCQESALSLRHSFHMWLESETFIPIQICLREELRLEDNIRIIVQTGDRNVKKLPWHSWDFVRRYPKAEVALSSLGSYSPLPPATPKSRHVQILAILGQSEGVDIDRDRQLLESLPNAEVTFLVEPTRREVNDKLLGRDWNIFFFAGYSATEGNTGRLYINSEDTLEVRDLWYSLRKAIDRGLSLAILNSCDGLGMGQELEELGVPVSIVMSDIIPDRVAQEFLKYFLSAFSSNRPLYQSVREAREQLQALENEIPCASWLPIIYQNPAASTPNWSDLYRPELPTWKTSLIGKLESWIQKAKRLFSKKDEIDIWLKELEDTNENIRDRSAYKLGILGEDKAVPYLCKSLTRDRSDRVRWQIAMALGKIGSETAIPALCEALSDDSSNAVRLKAAEALGQIGQKNGQKNNHNK